MGDADDALSAPRAEAPEGAARAGTFEVALPRGLVRYRDLGATSSPDEKRLLFLHGLGHDAAHWDDLLELLALRQRVIAPDLAPDAEGRGLSLQALGEQVVDLVAAIGVGRVTLVGHDSGAALALLVATEWPEFVERLVLIAPPILPRRAHVEERLALLPLVGRALFRRGLGRLVLRRRGAAGKVDETTLPLLRETTERAALFARLPRVRCPTMLVFGRKDRIEPWTHGQRLVRELPSARLEVVEGGHCPAEEDPDRLAELIERFLREARA
ncbi:MAG: alpha/beta fold hydrolase [Myxococcales bacterium]|nr:alpha/beta fold hydrolase [Myxococcales bacterium]